MLLLRRRRLLRAWGGRRRDIPVRQWRWLWL